VTATCALIAISFQYSIARCKPHCSSRTYHGVLKGLCSWCMQTLSEQLLAASEMVLTQGAFLIFCRGVEAAACFVSAMGCSSFSSSCQALLVAILQVTKRLLLCLVMHGCSSRQTSQPMIDRRTCHNDSCQQICQQQESGPQVHMAPLSCCSGILSRGIGSRTMKATSVSLLSFPLCFILRC